MDQRSATAEPDSAFATVSAVGVAVGVAGDRAVVAACSRLHPDWLSPDRRGFERLGNPESSNRRPGSTPGLVVPTRRAG